MTREMTFTEQQEVNEILEQFLINPSNRNKYRYQLFAYIDELLASPNLKEGEQE